jgi:hypothetical protein
MLFGQISIDADDMPSAGDMTPFNVTALLPEGSDPSQTGENFVWDYSQLSPVFDGVDTFYTVAQTPFLYQFYFNNGFLFPNHQADVARKEMSVNLGLVNITDSYSYIKNDEEGYRNVGFGANVNGIPSSVRNIPIDWVYEFPLEYLDESVSPSANELAIPTLGFYRHEQVREVMVEGWGTLNLPNDSYEVLKVKMVVNATDSIYIEAFDTGIPIVQPEETIYQWLAIGGGEPLLQISQQGGFGYTVKYRFEDALALEENEEIELDIYPNPTSDILSVRSKESILSAYAIFNASGAAVQERKGKTQTKELNIPIHNLRTGRYYLLLTTPDQETYYSPFLID